MMPHGELKVNRFILTINNDYDQFTVDEYVPIITKHTKEEVEKEIARIINVANTYTDWYEGHYEKKINFLDTGLKYTPYQLGSHENHCDMGGKVYTIDEWFDNA